MNTYIFDFDGTLVDSMPYWARVMKDFLDSENAKYPSDIIKIITQRKYLLIFLIV